MKELTEVVQALWGTFLMRDVVAKAVPGAVLLTSVLFALTGRNPFPLIQGWLSQSKDFSVAVSILAATLLFGTSYISGFIAQTVAFDVLTPLFKYTYWGEVIASGREKYTTGEIKTKLSEPKRWRALCPERRELAANFAYAFSLKAFSDLTADDQWKRFQRERFVVVKEMSANMAVALVIAALVLGVGELAWARRECRDLQVGLVELLAAILIAGGAYILWKSHVIHRERQTKYEIHVLELDRDGSELETKLKAAYAQWASKP